MQNKKKSIFIIPPCQHLIEPPLGAPLLVGQLQQAGYDACCLDLNADFFNSVLSSKYLFVLKKEFLKISKIKNYANKQKQEKISKILCDSSLDFAIKYIDEAVGVYRGQDFYNPTLLFRAFRVISITLDILSVAMFPYKIAFSSFDNLSQYMDMKNIDKIVEDYDSNIFYRYYFDRIERYISSNVGLVGISITSAQNVLPSLTIARLIKKKFKGVNVCIGGNAITRCAEAYMRHRELFTKYCDFISVGEGEKSIVELVRYLNNEVSLASVPGMIYENDQGEIVLNRVEKIKNFNGIAIPSFDGIDFKKYLSPKIVLPVLTSKGCYWGKCSFCDYFHGEKYFGQMPIKKTIHMLESLQEKYGIDYFEFVDDAMTPYYLDELSSAIIDNNLNIKYHIMIRTEKEFTKELLKKAYKSGLRLILLGYESESERIIKLMNKGIEHVDRKAMLINSANVGIWNFVCFLFGFPTETDEEWQMTQDFLFDNQDIIDNYVATVFRLDKHSQLTDKLKQSLSKEEYIDNEFSKLFVYNTNEEQYKQKKLADMKRKLLKKEGIKLWNILIPGEYIFLYVAEKGRKYTKSVVVRSFFQKNIKAD